jgi:RNA polymerase sigma-70 factor, ECF subfamily
VFFAANVLELRPAPDPSEATEQELRREDSAVVAALLAGNPHAPERLFDRYGTYVERLLVRIIGRDEEIEDLLHEVFADALEGIHRLRDPGALRPWLTRIAVFTARSRLRSRTRSRWLSFRAHDEVPEETCEPTQEDHDVAERVYRCLAHLSADDRIAFTLREIHEMTLPEVAEACNCSLATVKRRIARGKACFSEHALRDPVLRARMPDDVRSPQGDES